MVTLTDAVGYCEECKAEREKVAEIEDVSMKFRGYPVEFKAPVARCKECGTKMADEECTDIKLGYASQVYMKAMDYSTQELRDVILKAVKSGMKTSDIHEALKTEKIWLDKWMSGKMIPKPESIKLIKELKAKLQ